MKTQKESILSHLKNNSGITPLQALNLYGCFRLGAIIYNLRDAGNRIETIYTTKKTRFGKKTFATYKLK
jgi:hypothetical protein